MNYQDLMELRDETIKNSVKKRFAQRFPQEAWERFERELDESFFEGSRFWLMNQVTVLFEGRAENILKTEIDDARM
jgi:hypothetical protein